MRRLSLSAALRAELPAFVKKFLAIRPSGTPLAVLVLLWCCAPITQAAVDPAPTATAWSYHLCDEVAFTNGGRSRAWCDVRGGTWVPGGTATCCCEGVQPVTKEVVYLWGEAFETSVHSACTISGADGGWFLAGQTLDSPDACSSGGPTYSNNGIELSSLKRIEFSDTSSDCAAVWSENVMASRSRGLACGRGYELTGDQPCILQGLNIQQ